MRDRTMEFFLRMSMHRVMDQYLPKMRQCLAVLSTDQLWEHEVHQANSIGGILLHVCEQVYRHTTGYQQAGPVSAPGVENYFPDEGMSPKELTYKVEETFSAWRRAMEEFLLDSSQDVDMFSIYHLVEHTSYHLGQVIDRTMQKTGRAFGFVQNGLNERALRAIVDDEFLPM